MKSDVETVNPTRVKLTVEVPFEELKPALDKAYKTISAQVVIPGFRKGKVPPRLIDQRVGRGAVLEEAVQEALPRLYSQAVTEHDVKVIGQPEVEVTRLEDGDLLAFTAEVDVHPEFELPGYDGLEVSVADAVASDSDVADELESLRTRFGVLRGVERPAQEGDFLSIDLAAAVEGQNVDSATGLSYEVGSDNLLEGLDEAVRGTSAGETVTFTTELAGGEHAGQLADVSITVKSVKERELPELDDDFAQTASEFDTLAELRDDIRARIERMERLAQGASARDQVLESLLASADVPLPEGLVTAEIDGRRHNLEHQLERAGMSKEEYLAREGQDAESFDADLATHARDAIKAQFVLDAIAVKENLNVEEAELSEHIVRRASRSGMTPEAFAQQVVKAGQVQMLVAEVIRGKALSIVLDRAKIVDASGRAVDLEALSADASLIEAALEDLEAYGDDSDHEAHDDETHDARAVQTADAEPVRTASPS